MMNEENLRSRNVLVLALNIVGAVSFLAFLLSIVASSWPTKFGLVASDFILRGRPFFPQEYDTFIFRVILIAAAILTIVAYVIFRKHLNNLKVASLLQRALAGQAIGLLLMGIAVYLMTIYPTISAFAWLQKGVMGVVLLYTMTLPWHERCFAYLAGHFNGRLIRILMHAVVGVLTVAVVWVNPNLTATAAKTYGLSLDTGMIIYMQALVIAYLLCLYVLLLRVVPSIALTCLGLCWAMKWLLFHPGIKASFYFTPSLIHLAHGAGALFFLLLWQDRHQGKSCWLVFSFLVAMMSYKIYTPAGVFLTASLMMYLFLQGQHQWRWRLLTVIAAAGAYATLSITPWVAFEGFVPVPFYFVLRERLFYMYVGSLLLIVFYLSVILRVFRLVLLERKVGLAWQGALACYGLFLACNYARLVVPSYFYLALWPLLVLILPFLNQLIDRLKARVLIIIFMAILTAAFLFGNPWFLWSVPLKGLGG